MRYQHHQRDAFCPHAQATFSRRSGGLQVLETRDRALLQQIFWFDQNVPLYEVEATFSRISCMSSTSSHGSLAAGRRGFRGGGRIDWNHLAQPDSNLHKQTHLSLRKTSTQCLFILGDRKHRDNNSQKLKPTRPLCLSPENPPTTAFSLYPTS